MNVGKREMGAREDLACQTLAFAQQSEQQMFSFNTRAAEITCLVPGEENHAAGSLGVPFKHRD